MKRHIDSSFERIDNVQKYLFNRRLLEVRNKVLFDLAAFNDKGQHALSIIFLARAVLENVELLVGAIGLAQNQREERQELIGIKATVENLHRAVLHSLRVQPRFLSHSGRSKVAGNEILDLLLAKAAFVLKYETDE
jgi:hypothetical protein